MERHMSEGFCGACNILVLDLNSGYMASFSENLSRCLQIKKLKLKQKNNDSTDKKRCLKPTRGIVNFTSPPAEPCARTRTMK